MIGTVVVIIILLVAFFVLVPIDFSAMSRVAGDLSASWQSALDSAGTIVQTANPLP